jgi:hypothetical protein
MKVVASSTSGGGLADLASPKSQSWRGKVRKDEEELEGRTLRSQLELRRRFEGFRSLWRTSAECKALRALSV